MRMTLGLLICKDMDKVEAPYALESTSQPLGISSYELSKMIPEEFKFRQSKHRSTFLVKTKKMYSTDKY